MHTILGSYEELYDILNVISFFVLLIFNLTQLKSKKNNLSKISLIFQKKMMKNNKISKKRKIFSSDIFLATIETIIISCVQYLPTTILNWKFGKLLGTGANYFGLLFFIPYILLGFCMLFKIDPWKQIDLITPAFPVALSVAKIACFCAGCCRGIACSFGVYNSYTQVIEFPIQLLEAGVALLIFIFLLFWRKRAKTGTVLPAYMIIYSTTRFFTEFLRGEPNVFWGLKTYHILCIIGVIVGIVELFAIKRFGEKISKICTFNTVKREKSKKGKV